MIILQNKDMVKIKTVVLILIKIKHVSFPDFFVKMVKQDNFLDAIDVSFDERFPKCYHFKLH